MIQHITKGITTGALAVVLGLAGVACDDGGDPNTTGGGGNGGGGGSGGSGGESSQGAQYVDAICGKLFECCNAKDLVARVGNSGIVDYAGCRILYRTFWEGGYEPTVKESEASGRATFDEAAFASCLDALKGQSCNEFATNNFAGCDDFIIPKVEKGGACAQDFECKTKACEVPDGATLGTCVDAPAPAAEGAACADNDECADGLYCDGPTDTCAQKKPDGQACTSNTQCQNGTCALENGMGTCATVCQGGGPGPGSIDAALETVGAAYVIAGCKRTFACCTEQERMDSLFDTEAECRLLTGALLGVRLVSIHNDVAEGRVSVDPEKLASCAQAYEALTCEESAKDQSGLDCEGALVGLVADGQSCTDHGQCASKYCNEPSGQPMGTCAALPGVGAPCTDTCAESLYCAAGTCAPQKAIGAACNTTNECVEGKCVADAMGAKSCVLVCDGI